MRQSFGKLEEKYSVQNLDRTENILNREMDYLDKLLQDWSFWNDTFYFTETESEDYILSNLMEETFYAASINLVYFYNNEDVLIWGEVYDLENEKNITTDSFASSYINQRTVLIKTEEFKEEYPAELVQKGFMNTEYGLLMIVSRPILKSDLSGPPAGTMIMGNF